MVSVSEGRAAEKTTAKKRATQVTDKKSRGAAREPKCKRTTTPEHVASHDPMRAKARAGTVESRTTKAYAAYVRREIAQALPSICEMLLRKSVDGDTTATKLLWQMAMLDRKTTPRKTGGTGAERGFAGKTLLAFRTELAEAMDREKDGR
jgi:hypothetical protein